MKNHRSIVVVSVVLAASACASMTGAYAPYSTWKTNGTGYLDTQLADNQWMVAYRGNGATDRFKVIDFTLLRAAELTVSSGFRYFLIESSVNTSTSATFVTAGQSSTSGQAVATCTGAVMTTCSASGSSTTSYVPPEAYEIVRPGLAIHVIAIKQPPENGGAFDAQLLVRTLKQKYGLP